MQSLFRALPSAAILIVSILGVSSCSKEQDAAPTVKTTTTSNVGDYDGTIFGATQIKYSTQARYSYTDNNSASAPRHHWEWQLSGTSNLRVSPIVNTLTGGFPACYVIAGSNLDGPQNADLVLYDNGQYVISRPVQSGDIYIPSY